jgi:hypothetical protein
MTAHYFSCSGGTGAVSIKSTLGQVTLNLCFAFGGICGSRSALQCIRVVKRRCTILHAHVGPVRIPQKAQLGHVKPNLCLASGRILCVTQCILVRLGHERSTHYFSCLGGTDTGCTKMSQDTLRQTCVFASGGIYGSRSAFLCLRGTKCRCTISRALVGLVQFP